MKHLKKLSVVLMMTTLLSASFTSCIDTEVSPVVEAIYEAQADLIAAQTAVQNAEADYRSALAAYEQANADYRAAQTAQLEVETAGMEADNAYQAAQREQYLLALVAETNLEVAEYQHDLAIAQAEFDIEMAELIAELEAAGVQLAVEYAYDYRYAMQAASTIYSDLLTAQNNLADAELMVVDPDGLGVGTEVSYAYHLAMLTNSVAEAQASVDDIQAKLDMFNDSAEDPIAVKELLDAQKVDLRSQYEELQQQRADQLEVIGLINFDEVERDSYTAELTGVAGTPLFDHNANVTTKNGNLTSIKNAEKLIAEYQEAIDDYAGVTTTLTQAVTDAQTAVDAAKLALGMEDAVGNTPAVGGYYPVDADEVAIAIGGTKYAAPANLQEVYVNARIDLLDATKAHDDYATAMTGLTASYNAAAVALESAQAAYDGNTYAADLAEAQTDVDNEETAFDAAMLAYTNAKNAFEADPTGSVFADGLDVHAGTFLADGYDNIDLGETGIHSDLAGDTYMRVDTWKESSIGSGDYVPASFYPTKYNAADLAAHITAIKADVTNAENVNITVDADIWVWEATGAGSMVVNDGAGAEVNPDDHALDATQAGNADTDNLAVFVNVELDDTSVTNLYTFNVATNMLGNNDFSDRAFDIDAPTYATPNYILLTDANASYDLTPDSEGESTGDQDAFTAYAALWNAQLDLAIAQDAFDTGDDALVAAQEAFDFQKELFDEGVANLADLASDKTAATTANTAAKKAVDEAWVALGQSFPEGKDGDTARVKGDAAPTDSLTLSEMLFNAEIALDTHLATTVADYEGWIAAREADIVAWEAANDQLQVLIDAQYAVVAELLGELTDLGIEYTFEVDEDGLGQFAVTNDLSGNYTDLSAELIAANKVLWDIDRDIAIVSDQRALVDSLISAWNSSYDTFVNTTIPGLESSLVTAQTDLAEAQAALALATNDEAAATANIAYLQSLVDTLEARHANALAIAAKYKALMDAALAS